MNGLHRLGSRGPLRGSADRGERITVLDVKRRIIDAGEDPHVVAGEYEISMAALFTALAYYYEHRTDFEAREREYERARTTGERDTHDRIAEALNPADRAD